jgi:hypothetical protein
MPSPVFAKMQGDAVKPLTLTPGAKRLLKTLYQTKHKGSFDNDDVAKIGVSELISKMAFYYEKIRNSVDYREEFLLRKVAIVRILKRLMLIEGGITGHQESDSFKLAQSLLIELIRAGYLVNNTLPEIKIEEFAGILERYIFLRKRAISKIVAEKAFANKKFKRLQDETKARTQITNWILGMAASEIEENLSQNNDQDAFVDEMFTVLSRSVNLPSDLPFDEDLPIQLYLSISRTFLGLNDNDVLSYVLLRYYYPGWGKADEALVTHIADNLSDLFLATASQLNHPLKPQITRIAEQYTVYFMILKDVLEENPEGVYNDIVDDPKSFPRKIKTACEKRYNQAKSKLWRSAVRSIIYIFLTKSVFVVLLEVPAIKFFGEQVNNFSLALNISFPAVLLFFAVALTKLPSEANTEKIVKGIDEIMFEEKVRKQAIVLRQPARRGLAINIVFTIIYTATFVLTFGLVVWFLQKIHFSWVSIIIFLFFLTFAGFFAIRIKRGVKSLVVVAPKENIFTFLWSFFYIPVISTGKWLSGKFASINIFVFVLDFIIEAPFKVFVAVAEEWTKYIRERRENIN